jgi:23S rRNA pseudouridine2605 synthase
MPAERIQKLLARAGIASRRGAEALIVAGRVTLNGRVATIGESADLESDRLAVDGRPLGDAAPTIHLAVHKPPGMLSSSRDERGRRSVVHLLDRAEGIPRGRLWPAGRLDVASEGLVVLTNDGAWANRFLHPRYGVEREYAVLVDRAASEAEIEQLLRGVRLTDGPARLLAVEVREPPAEVEREPDETGSWLRVRVGEGRKREVRRLFTAVGLRVLRLVRTAFGPLTLAGLRSGAWRRLSDEEVRDLGAPAHERPGRAAALTVAIDGPSGSGKSTVGWALAQRLGATFVDTGLLYRALTLAALEGGIDPEDAAGLGELARRVTIEVERPGPEHPGRRETVLLDGRDVTDEARTPRIDRGVSSVSRHAAVRDAMLEVQRAAARRGDTVMVGRDIATVVLPDATLKVFLTASPEIRAQRRAAEMGRPDRLEAYRAEIEQRDAADAGRAVAPLRQAPDALVLDAGELDVDGCVDAIVAALR